MPKVSSRYLEERKSEIIDAAEACFLRKGFHQCTMQDICRESSLSPGAIYRYFKSKSDIIAAVIGRSTERQAAQIEEARGSYSQAARALEAIGEHFFGRLEREGMERVAALELEVWEEALRNEELRATYRRQFRVLSQALSELYRLAVEQAGIRSPATKPAGLAHLAMALFHGLQLYRALYPDEVNVREVLETLSLLLQARLAESQTRRELKSPAAATGVS
jgi:TetR/AcrR family transcriptional regulator, repressor for uid operon